MKFGLSKDQYEFIIKTVVTPLKSPDTKIYCYGSRARGDYQKFSDLDLMIDSKKELQKEISHIKEILTKSNFPFKVDIVELRNFAKSYFASYERDKVQI